MLTARLAMNSTSDVVCIGGETNLYFWRRNPNSELGFERAEIFQQAHSLEVNCVDWSLAPGNVLASVSDDRFCYIWRIKGEQIAQTRLI